MENKNLNRRYLGKIKEGTYTKQSDGTTFTKKQILIDNPHSVKAGQPNKYYKGHLLWFDAATETYYQVLQMDITNSSEDDKSRGFSGSIKIDLNSAYHVKVINTESSEE